MSDTAPAQPTQPSAQVPEDQHPDVVPNGAPPANFKPRPEKVVFEWHAPNRPYKKRNSKYFTTLGIIVALIGLILFFAGQFLAIAVVLAVAFLAYVLSAIPPEMVVNKITTYGIRTDNAMYYWEECGRFWYTSKYNQRLLHIEVGRFPNHLTLLLGDIKEDEMTELLSEVLLQEQPVPSALEKAAAWLEEKIPLDTEA
jgi:hypothetical protein